MRTTQKARERFFIELLQAVDDDFPPGDLEDSESPDFLVRTPQQVIGIDVTEYFQPSPRDGGSGSFLRMQSQITRQATDLAMAEYAQASDIPLWVSVQWMPGISLRRQEVPSLGSSIAAVVARSVPQANPDTVELTSDDIEGSGLETRVVSIRIRRRRNVTSNYWGRPEVGFVGVDHGEIQAIISRKESKLGNYLKKCDAAWLVIVASSSDISSTGELHEDVRTHTFQTGFSRVVWFDVFDEQAVTLNTCSE